MKNFRDQEISIFYYLMSVHRYTEASIVGKDRFYPDGLIFGEQPWQT